MNKYGEITTTGGSGLISLNNVILARLFGGNFILINYANGSLCSIQATTAFTQADAEVIFDVIQNAQEQKWDTVKYTVPTLSDSVASISFTF